MKQLIISSEFLNPEYYEVARLPINVDKSILLLKLHSIIYLEADGSYCKIHTTDKDQPYHITKNIGYLEKVLPTHSFFRIHNKYIVNLNYVHSVIREGHWRLKLLNETIVKISDEKKDDFLKKNWTKIRNNY